MGVGERSERRYKYPVLHAPNSTPSDQLPSC